MSIFEAFVRAAAASTVVTMLFSLVTWYDTVALAKEKEEDKDHET